MHVGDGWVGQVAVWEEVDLRLDDDCYRKETANTATSAVGVRGAGVVGNLGIVGNLFNGMLGLAGPAVSIVTDADGGAGADGGVSGDSGVHGKIAVDCYKVQPRERVEMRAATVDQPLIAAFSSIRQAGAVAMVMG
jgi:hypothetical protein